MREKKSRATAAVIVSDLHCGCRFGLSLGRLTLDGGMRHEPSALQQHLARRGRCTCGLLDGIDVAALVADARIDQAHP